MDKSLNRIFVVLPTGFANTISYLCTCMLIRIKQHNHRTISRFLAIYFFFLSEVKAQMGPVSTVVVPAGSVVTTVVNTNGEKI